MNSPSDSSSQEKKTKHKNHPLLWLVVFVCLICSGSAFYAWQDIQTFLHTAPASEGTAVIINIEPGMTLAQASALLEKEGIITSAARFQILARYKEKGRSLQAGRFLLNTGWLPEKVLDMLASGKAMLYRLTLREGLTWWETAEILEKEGFCKATDFTSVIHDPEFLRHWGIPFESAEGFLFPETYLLPKPREMNKQSARSMANRLVEMFWRKADTLWQKNRPAANEVKRLVTLASIVEKETAVPEERPRVAGVYQKRLDINMLLQADPTVIYGLGKTFSGSLLRKHLEDPNNRYNTYKNQGLPPGPICSFGLSALQAALAPEQHDYLYFVASGTGNGHIFSKNLTEHNKAVREYRDALKKNKL